MFKVIIDRERCKACGLCVRFCPRDNIELSAERNKAGYHPAQIISQEACTGCGVCVLMCPDVCIEIYQEATEAKGHA